MNYLIRYTDKDTSDQFIIEALNVREAIDEALKQLPDHIVILSALQTNL